MNNKSRDLKERTRAFGLAAVRLYAYLPKATVAQVLGKQLLRSRTSVGAQFREGQRAKSIADFINGASGFLMGLYHM
jgi:four helix bundle protein